MTRRLVLAWCTGATLGLAVGFLLGESVRDGLDFRRLAHERREAEEYWATVGRRPGPEQIARAVAVPARPGPREGLPAGTSATGATNGPQTGAQPRWVDLFGIDPDYTDGVPVDEFIERNRAGFGDPIPSQRDDEPCPQYSPGGGIPCSVTGPHTAHIFLGSTARDRKEDADERIE